MESIGMLIGEGGVRVVIGVLGDDTGEAGALWSGDLTGVGKRMTQRVEIMVR